MNHFDAVGVAEARAAGGLGVGGRDDFHRAALVHAQAPLGDVEVVRAPISHHAARVFPVVPPVGEVRMNPARAEHRIVRALRGGPQPEIPVEAGLQRFRRQVARHGRRADVHDYLFDPANTPVANQFAGFAKLAG